ncbi:MAG: hypothetical protein U5K43_05370 [Halofilum sp. (in: g-proteobacteria)]|nr:hypothetical protein [Halofilum sp. (in: g-proteobacteria)]
MGLWRRLSDAILPGRQPVAAPDTDPEAEIETCLREHVRPALEAVRDRLASEGFEVSLEADDEAVELRAMNFNGLPLVYRARGFVYKEPVVNLASMGEQGKLARFARIEIESGGKTREFPTSRCHREAMEKGALAYYRRFLMRSP